MAVHAPPDREEEDEGEDDEGDGGGATGLAAQAGATGKRVVVLAELANGPPRPVAQSEAELVGNVHRIEYVHCEAIACLDMYEVEVFAGISYFANGL